MTESLRDQMVRLLESEKRGVVEVSEITGVSKQYVLEVWRILWESGRTTMSPYAMVQERVRGSSDYPWKVIVTSCLMNRTHARQVRKVIRALFLMWPTPADMARAGSALEEMLGPLGFSKQRAVAVRRMSADYDRGVIPERCFGVGDFGRDAVAAFVHGRTDIEPKDGFLVKYVRWRRTGEVDI